MSEDPEKPKDYWIHRRIFAWSGRLALFSILIAAMTGYQFQQPELISDLVWVFALDGLVWSGGASVVDAVAKLRGK